jgi:hypothetical protein
MLFGRRVRFAILILASQLLLIALSVFWFIQMLIIAQYGAVQFTETHRSILFTEISLTAAVSIFAIIIFVIQLVRLGEHRRNDSQERRQRN